MSNRPTGETVERRQHPTDRSRLRGTRTAVIALLILVVALPSVTGFVTYVRARSLIVDEIQTGQQAAAAALANDVRMTVHAADSVAAAGARRPELLTAINEGEVFEIERALRAVYDTLPAFRTFAVVDGSGGVIAAWPKALKTSLDDIALGTSREALRPYSIGNDAILPLRYPLGSDTALVAEFSFATALPDLPDFRFGETGTATLVDRDAVVLVAGAEQRRNRKLRAEEVVKLASGMQAGQVRYYAPLLDRRNISTFEPVAGHEFGILVDMAESEALGATVRLAWLVVASIFGVVLVGGAISWLVGRKLASNERTLQSMRDAAEHQALTDPLTGLANRRAFDEAFEEAFAASRRAGTPFAVTMFDLNSFKLLNDNRGHAAGDAALRAVAAEMRGAIRAGDLAARLGGDEFAVMHPHCEEQAAMGVAARIAEAVERLGLLSDPRDGSVLTVSSGTAQLNDQVSASLLLAEADVNLYRAKKQRNMLCAAQREAHSPA